MASVIPYLSGQGVLSGDFSPPPLFPSPLPGNPGGTGGNAYTTTSASFVQVAGGSNVSVQVLQSGFLAVGQAVFVANGGYYTVASITGTTVVLTANGGGQVAAPGATVPTNSALVPSGYPFNASATTGSNGIAVNAFTTTTAPFNQVAAGVAVTVTVAQTAFMAVGQALFIATSGYYTVQSITSGTVAVLMTLAQGVIATTGAIIASGSSVTPAGYAVDVSGNAAAILALANQVTTLTGLVGAGSVKTTYSGVAPSSPNVGDLWFNSASNNQIEMWNGSGWVVVSSVPTILNSYYTTTGTAAVSLVTTMPSSPTNGQLVVWLGAPGTFVPHTLYIYNGASWQPSITTITSSMITTGTITAGMISAGAIGAAAVGTNLLITNSAMIANAVISASSIISLTAGQITAGTINAQTISLGTSGGTGIIQSSNFVTSVSGWQIAGDGSAEFTNVKIRGNLVTGSVSNAVTIFNPAFPANTMNSVASASGSASPGASSMGTGLFYSLVSFFGWASGLGTATTRFGKSTMTFLCAANYAYTLSGSNQAVTNMVYRINGGSWQNVNPWAVATVGPKSGDSISYAVTISGLAGTEQIDFGNKHADANAGDVINVTNISVTALNF